MTRFLIQGISNDFNNHRSIKKIASELGIQAILCDVKNNGVFEYFSNENVLNNLSNDDIPFGNISFIKEIVSKNDFIRRKYCDFDKLKYSNYASKIGNDLLNYRHSFVLKGNCEDSLIESFSDEMFVRPDNNEKTFDGGLYKKKEIKELSKECDIIVAEPFYDIKEEYRIIVKEGEFITGSSYRECLSDIVPADVISLGINIFNKLKIHNVLTIDIARSEYRNYVIEVGSICCAGLYNCDLKKIVLSLL